MLAGWFAAYEALISLDMISYAPAITPMENTPTAMEKTTSNVRALLSNKSCRTLRHLGRMIYKYLKNLIVNHVGVEHIRS